MSTGFFALLSGLQILGELRQRSTHDGHPERTAATWTRFLVALPGFVAAFLNCHTTMAAGGCPSDHAARSVPAEYSRNRAGRRDSPRDADPEVVVGVRAGHTVLYFHLYIHRRACFPSGPMSFSPDSVNSRFMNRSIPCVFRMRATRTLSICVHNSGLRLRHRSSTSSIANTKGSGARCWVCALYSSSLS